MTPERREEVRQLLRATARHLAAKKRGEDSQLGYASVRPLDAQGNPTGEERRSLGLVQFSIPLKDVDPEIIDVMMGENGECHSCGNEEDYPNGECPKSHRTCGHHCNHIRSHDHCHWCGFDEPWR